MSIFGTKSSHLPSREILTIKLIQTDARLLCIYSIYICKYLSSRADQAKSSNLACCIVILMYYITPCLSEYQSYRGLSLVSCRMFRNGLNKFMFWVLCKANSKRPTPSNGNDGQASKRCCRLRELYLREFYLNIRPVDRTILANCDPISKTEPCWCRPMLRPISSFFPPTREIRD